MFLFLSFWINRTNEVAPSGGEGREGTEISPLCSLLLRSPRDHRVCVPAAADVPVPDQTLLPTEQVSLSFIHSFSHDDDDDDFVCGIEMTIFST